MKCTADTDTPARAAWWDSIRRYIALLSYDLHPWSDYLGSQGVDAVRLRAAILAPKGKDLPPSLEIVTSDLQTVAAVHSCMQLYLRENEVKTPAVCVTKLDNSHRPKLAFKFLGITPEPGIDVIYTRIMSDAIEVHYVTDHYITRLTQCDSLYNDVQPTLF